MAFQYLVQHVRATYSKINGRELTSLAQSDQSFTCKADFGIYNFNLGRAKTASEWSFSLKTIGSMLYHLKKELRSKYNMVALFG